MFSLATRPSNGQYSSSWMRTAVQFHHDAEHSVSEPHDELKRYIESPLEDVENVVIWWGVSDDGMIFTGMPEFTYTVKIAASLGTIPNTLKDGKGLSCYPRLSYSLRESILEWWYHWHCQAQPPHTRGI